jgi:CBS domain-containing protein
VNRRRAVGARVRAQILRERDALAAMAAGRTDCLPVVDHDGRPLGAITLADLVR